VLAEAQQLIPVVAIDGVTVDAVEVCRCRRSSAISPAVTP
jgi:hypothetical protein